MANAIDWQDLQKYPNYGRDDTKLVDPYEFVAALKLIKYWKGRSAVVFIVEDVVTRHRYSMCISEFVLLSQSLTCDEGVFRSARYGFMKRGTAVGIKFLEKV